MLSLVPRTHMRFCEGVVKKTKFKSLYDHSQSCTSINFNTAPVIESAVIKTQAGLQVRYIPIMYFGNHIN